jgi:hypothetical protein
MTLKTLLEEQPQARERKFKNRAIARIIEKQFNPIMEHIHIETTIEVVAEALRLDRQWRKLLADNPHLRGKDYGDKEELEQKAQIELGYEAGGTLKLKL